ncbi:MAG: DUF2911 domain-containing protein [Candidatus Eisenbacteria bacterium]
MKPSRMSSLALAVAVTATFVLAVPTRAELVLPRLSPKASVTQQVGITDLSVTYSRPGVKGRKIWGELVPLGKTWRAGANEPTTFTTSDDITVGGQKLAAGSYAILAVPAEGAWTMIFSRQKDLMGSGNYDEKQDALRVPVTPAAAEAQEWLQYSFEDVTPSSASLALRWEKLKVALPITVDVAAITLAKGKTELAAAKADDWRSPYRMAQYSFDSNVAPEDGARWLDQSIAIQPSYSNLNLKARWLARSGDTKGAIDAAKKALEINKKAETPADASTLEASLAEWSGKKKKKS